MEGQQSKHHRQFIDPDDVDWSIPVADSIEDAFEWIKREISWNEATKSIDSIMARSADLNILSQVTLPKVSRKGRDYYWLLQHALSLGATITTIGSAEWFISGDCAAPYCTTFRAPPYSDAWGRTKRHCALYLDIHTRCRRCEPCLQHRAALWRIRAATEVQDSVRTWMGTLTLSPREHFYVELKAREASAKSFPYHDFDTLTGNQQFMRKHAVISRYITLRLNAFREAYKRKHGFRLPFKYFIVAEAHKSGLPHYHALFHERNLNAPIRYAELRPFWPHGFSQFKLVQEDDNPLYLCKYLSKSMLARVRASQHYGQIRPNAIDSHEVSRKNTRPHKKAPF